MIYLLIFFKLVKILKIVVIIYLTLDNLLVLLLILHLFLNIFFYQIFKINN